MSWLYSVILAGLMFSGSGGDIAFSGKQYNPEPQTSTEQVVKLDETEKFEQSYNLNPKGKVRVSNVNGSITIEAWDKAEVKLEATKIAENKEMLADVEIKVDSTANSFSVESDYDNWNSKNSVWKNRRNLEVHYRLMVPRTAVLEEIEAVNGSVTVSNFTNSTNVSAVNGQVKATNLRGNASLSTVNGTVNADFDSLEASSKIELETVNGQVNLLIPSDSNATIKADTVNGRIANDFGLPVRKGEYVGKDLYGRLGNGSAKINLSSVNGGLIINRKNDGKNPSSTTNLLNDANSEDSEDAESKVDVKVNVQPKIKVDKMNKDIAKAMKDSEKDRAESMREAEREIQEAMREMQVELKNLDPQTRRIAEEAVRTSLESLRNMKDVNLEDLQIKIEAMKLDQLANLERLAEINWTESAPSIEKKSETFRVKGTPKVSINAIGCDVKVSGWDKSEVQYVVKKLSRGGSKSPIAMTADASDSEVKIVVNNQNSEEESFDEGGKNVFVEVFVPKKSNLKIATDGEIRIESVTGELELNGTEGAVNIRDAEGKLRLFTADGRVRIIGFRGELESQTNDSEVFLEGDFTKINATSQSGDIYLTLPETANASIKTNSEIGFISNKNTTVFGSKYNVFINGDSVDFKVDESKANTEKCDGCIAFVKESEDTWKTGNGDSKFSFTTDGGTLYIRNSNAVVRK
ncbi:MAG TPA: hypothetical protein PKY59_16000 [Pyrinomonadaceae bacterium]|nr:hypothetical protein [Pyrinomonadaceae bacterium]